MIHDWHVESYHVRVAAHVVEGFIPVISRIQKHLSPCLVLECIRCKIGNGKVMGYRMASRIAIAKIQG